MEQPKKYQKSASKTTNVTHGGLTQTHLTVPRPRLPANLKDRTRTPVDGNMRSIFVSRQTAQLLKKSRSPGASKCCFPFDVLISSAYPNDHPQE